jgi:hypothetical protein
MPATADTVPAPVRTLYNRLEDRIIERDQRGASAVFYDLVREGRPLPEMLRETIRVHAPFTHVPYHQRIDGGVVRFVNNDHCLLSGSAALRLSRLVGKQHRFLPMAQTVWYVPTGLDPWNQLLGKMPGHYARTRFAMDAGIEFPRPSVHWEDQEPKSIDGTIEERLDHWLTLVQRGEVLESYRVFLGLIAEPEHREAALAQLVFAGLIDVQDRMYFNRSYTTGHKAYRARATVQLAEAVGFDDAHAVFYAGVPDIAVGPRWYSNYEMAGEVSWRLLAEDGEKQRSSIAATPDLPPERRLLANEGTLTPSETDMLLYALVKAPEPAYIDAITALLLAGKSARAIVDVMQVAATRVLLETSDSLQFAMPQHCAQYMNTLGWFHDRFDHPHRIKLLYVGGSFIAQTAKWVRDIGGNAEGRTAPPREATSLSTQAILDRLDDAIVRKVADESVAWTRAYIATGDDRRPLVRTLAMGAAKHGNDTHNQEVGLAILEDYETNRSSKRMELLLGAAQHNAGHVKYGDSLEPYRRFAEAFGMDSSQSAESDLDPIEALLDD